MNPRSLAYEASALTGLCYRGLPNLSLRTFLYIFSSNVFTRLDENEIIEYIRNIFMKAGKFHDFYDDVSYVKLGKALYVFKTDMLVESTDVPPGMKPEQISRKSVVSCISDLVAKGSIPKGFMISLGIPKEKGDEWVSKLLEGFLISSDEFDVELLGGDVNEAKELVIDCFMFGSAKRRIGRNGALVGDLIATVPKFGFSKLGLIHLLYGKPIPKEFEKEALDAVLMPKPPVKCAILIEKVANSSMDSSDGLAITLNEISKQSKKKIVLERLPAPEGFVDVVEGFGFDAEDLILYGGEEFQPVFTFKEELFSEVKKFSRETGIEISIIGRVEEGRGVFFQKDNILKVVENRGWTHLAHE